ncbi:short-subunit dehydrogenase [Skermanella aerolata]|uniref:Short-chain dehydrogenase n=1 Tax=Skermanella aerolata TaxID=393310 RepID=A0A512DPI9_9PROT|nr:SDR family oxidoreductase [Skermanella aerolata]KJB95646.1 short-chain dehydrogenase [Skermanella aerolata KACC 11604]GEO38394.1 short-chain dehydrogenase [Skermanella aerolata]
MKNVAIFGATSAIAEQVARLFAAEGCRLYLVARRADQLERVAADLRVRGAAEVFTFLLDFDDTANHASMLDDCARRLGDIAVALVAFGTLGDQERCKRDVAAAQAELRTNFMAPALLLTGLAQRMEDRRGAVIAAIGSVAGDRGRQSNYVYGAAKGGLDILLEGLRHRLAPRGVAVVTIKPGFVDTPMTASFPKGPLWAKPDKVAGDIRRAIEKRRPVTYTPGFWRLIMLVIKSVPRAIFYKTKL